MSKRLNLDPDQFNIDIGKTVYLLGAGISLDASIPGAVDFLSEFQEQLNNGQGNDKLANALKYLKQKLEPEYKPLDIEHILGTIHELLNKDKSLLRLFYQVPDEELEQHIGCFEDLADAIHDFIRKKCIVKPEKIRYLYDFKRLFDRQAINDIFTLNYDMCMEMLCEELDINYTDGFEPYWKPRAFDTFTEGVRLYKLHGSVVWYSTGARKPRLIKIPVSYTEGRLKYFTEDHVAEVMLYPMLLKGSNEEPFSTLIGKLREILDESLLCIAIGYSFRDDYIRDLIKERMALNPDLHLMIFAPDATKILKRFKDGSYEHCLERIAVRNMTIQDVLKYDFLYHHTHRFYNAIHIHKKFEQTTYPLISGIDDLKTAMQEYALTGFVGKAKKIYQDSMIDSIGELFGESIRQERVDEVSDLFEAWVKHKQENDKLRDFPIKFMPAVYYMMIKSVLEKNDDSFRLWISISMQQAIQINNLFAYICQKPMEKVTPILPSGMNERNYSELMNKVILRDKDVPGGSSPEQIPSISPDQFKSINFDYVKEILDKTQEEINSEHEKFKRAFDKLLKSIDIVHSIHNVLPAQYQPDSKSTQVAQESVRQLLRRRDIDYAGNHPVLAIKEIFESYNQSGSK